MKIDLRIDRVIPPPPPPSVPPPYRNLRVPDDGRFMVLVNDWETARWSYMARSRFKNYKKDPDWNGLPATIPMQKLFHVLNEPWQRRYFELYHEACFYSLSEADIIACWRHTMKDSGGLCDQHSFDWVDKRGLPAKLFTCFIQGLNPDSPYGPIQQQDLLFSGNIVKVIGEINDDYIIETLNTKLPPPPLSELWEKWWLVGWLTSSGYNWETGESRRMQWPWLRNFGTPYLVLGRDGRGRVPKYWCRPIANGATYSLYTP